MIDTSGMWNSSMLLHSSMHPPSPQLGRLCMATWFAGKPSMHTSDYIFMSNVSMTLNCMTIVDDMSIIDDIIVIEVTEALNFMIFVNDLHIIDGMFMIDVRKTLNLMTLANETHKLL